MGKYYSLTVKNGGLELEVTNVGGAIMRLLVPDSKGKLGDVVLGYDKPETYLKGNSYFGAIVGRVCNRVGNAKLRVRGCTFKLDANDGKNSLHGGIEGFHRKLWDITPCSGEGWKGLFLHRISPDGECGFAGNLDVGVYYKLTDNAELKIEYRATADAPTVCALTNHSFFNLSAGASADTLDHHIKIDADFFTPTDKHLVPTGEIACVKSTALDLRKFKKIRDGVESGCKFIEMVGGGFDHNYVLPNTDGNLVSAAVVYEPISGRSMEVLTTEVGMQFYSGNFLNGEKGKAGTRYHKYAGFALETQHWPNAQNLPHFPSIELDEGQTICSTTIYRFSAL